MSREAIAQRRLVSQHIARPPGETPAEVVRWLGAVQAQDFLGALWAVALRTPGASEQDVEAAIAARQIVRTWPMRGTIHFVAPEDARWMLELLAPRVIRGTQSRLRGLEIDDAVLATSASALSKALEKNEQLTRAALYDVLGEVGIVASGSRGLHILGQLSMQGLLCFGARAGKQPTFALLEQYAPDAKSLPKDEALARLTLRYFRSHGPATIKDFMWWSGLTTAEARQGLGAVGGELASETVEGQEYYFSPDVQDVTIDAAQAFLLPPFDEFLVAYRDRSASLDPAHKDLVVPGGNGIFNPIIVINGEVLGTWKRTFKKKNVAISFAPFGALSSAQRDACAAAAEQYRAFVGAAALEL